MDIPAVLESPFTIWAAIFAVVAMYLASASEKLRSVLGPLGKWIGGRKMRRLRRDKEYSDARVEALAEQVADLAKWFAVMRREQAAQWALLRTHQMWDDKVARQVRELGGEVEDPPPLYPPEFAA